MIKFIKSDLFNTGSPRTDGVVYYYQFFNDGELYGAARCEAIPQALLVHPSLFKVTKSNIARLRADSETVAGELADKYGYTFALLISPNEKLVKLVSANTAELVGEIDKYKIYRYELK